jgi:hypothetical protein
VILRDGGYCVTEREFGELFAPAKEKRIAADHECACPQLDQSCECRIEVPFGACIQDMKLQAEGAGRRLQVSQFGLGIVGRVGEHGNEGRHGYQLMRQLQSLRRHHLV